MPLASNVSDMAVSAKKICECGHLAENHHYYPLNDFATNLADMREALRQDAYGECMMKDTRNPCACKKFEQKKEELK